MRIWIALISILGGSVILALKWVAYAWTGSAALKSDALEGIVNVVAAVFALGALVYSEKPSDREHPYGHGKMENFSAAFEGGLVTLAAILILYEGASAILYGVQPRELGTGLLVNAISGILNGLLGWFLIAQGRKHQSKAIEADGHHVLSDFFTTIGLLLGLLLVWLTGWVWLDGVIAIAIGLLLVRTGFKLVRESSSALLDSEDPNILEKIVGFLNGSVPREMITIHGLRTLRSGRNTHVQADFVVPEFLSVREAHDLVADQCSRLMTELGLAGEVQAHIDPCGRAYCSSCAVDPCPVREAPCAGREVLTVEGATSYLPNRS